MALGRDRQESRRHRNPKEREGEDAGAVEERGTVDGIEGGREESGGSSGGGGESESQAVFWDESAWREAWMQPPLN